MRTRSRSDLKEVRADEETDRNMQEDDERDGYIRNDKS